MLATNYIKEDDLLFTKFPKIILWLYSVIALILPYSPFAAYLPTTDSLLYVNTLCIAGVIAANFETFKKKNSSIIDDLNWLFIAFGSAVVVSIVLLFVPTLGKSGSFLAFSAAIQILIVLIEMQKRRFPIALFLWSTTNLLLIFNKFEIPSHIFLSLAYPLTVLESVIRKLMNRQ